MKKEKLKLQVNDKVIELESDYVGNLFRVNERSIDEHLLLTEREKESIKRDLRSNKNILLG